MICPQGIFFPPARLMSSIKDNVGRGLNIALVNGVSGELLEARAFDMWAGGEWLSQQPTVHFLPETLPSIFALSCSSIAFSSQCRGWGNLSGFCSVSGWP